MDQGQHCYDCGETITTATYGVESRPVTIYRRPGGWAHSVKHLVHVCVDRGACQNRVERRRLERLAYAQRN